MLKLGTMYMLLISSTSRLPYILRQIAQCTLNSGLEGPHIHSERLEKK